MTVSTVLPEQTRIWLTVGVVVALFVAIGAVFVIRDVPYRVQPAAEAVPLIEVQERALPQAVWKITTFAPSTARNLAPADARAVDRQRAPVARLVRRVFDALFVHTEQLDATVAEHFAPAAATAFKRAGAGATVAGATRTTLRRARIGIQAAGGAQSAVAEVSIRAKAADRRASTRHRSTLWLARGDTGWKVVAFEVDQGPLPARKDGGAESRRGHKQVKGERR